MALGMPGTVGFVAEDLLVHGAVELHPFLAALLVAVAALNAAGLYLAIANVLAARGYDPRPDPPPTLRTVLPGLVAIVVGLAPGPFVLGATRAYEAVAVRERVSTTRRDDLDIPPP
jgi:NADH-quinone oxidoreductase subunit M